MCLKNIDPLKIRTQFMKQINRFPFRFREIFWGGSSPLFPRQQKNGQDSVLFGSKELQQKQRVRKCLEWPVENERLKLLKMDGETRNQNPNPKYDGLKKMMDSRN